MKSVRLTFLITYLIDICLGQDCKGLFELCNEDCDCCGHPDDKSVRCERRNTIGEKRCYIGRSMHQPCANHSECLSQNCVDGVCRPNNRVRVAVGECPLGNSDYIVSALSSVTLPQCSCSRSATDSAELAMDGDLSTDYINYYSQEYSGIFVEPTFKAPLKRMEICSSNQDESNDPLCYKVTGWCSDDNAYSDIQSGVIPFTSARRECVDIKIAGRQYYSKYKVEFGCRRGGYTEDCATQQCDPSKANCPVVTPLGIDQSCSPSGGFQISDKFSDFVFESVNYDAANDVTKYIYSFKNKLQNTGQYPDLGHAVLQYAGGCCVQQVRIYTIVNGIEIPYNTLIGPGNHLQSRKPTVCMSGIDLNVGLIGSITFYYEITIGGYFPTTTTVDYALKAGTKMKYGQVAGPDCRCASRRNLADKHLFRGLPVELDSHRALACVDQPVSISELKLFGKCNQA